MTALQIDRVEKCFKWLEDELSDTKDIHHIQGITDRLQTLASALPFINEQMAVAAFHYNQAKINAYQNLRASLKAQGEDLKPMLAKDYVASKCAVEAYNYDLCERCSRTIVHAIDALRTAASALKEELRNIQQ